mmetsp:Transcript_43/g.63  ORF Transcript_43/g.63 Transcript_43/m.63 type:complete len:313 (-) Transcript_43:581-1519(-)
MHIQLVLNKSITNFELAQRPNALEISSNGQQVLLHELFAIVVDCLIDTLNLGAKVLNILVKLGFQRKIIRRCCLIMNLDGINLRQKLLRAMTKLCILLIQKGHVCSLGIISVVNHFKVGPSRLSSKELGKIIFNFAVIQIPNHIDIVHLVHQMLIEGMIRAIAMVFVLPSRHIQKDKAIKFRVCIGHIQDIWQSLATNLVRDLLHMTHELTILSPLKIITLNRTIVRGTHCETNEFVRGWRWGNLRSRIVVTQQGIDNGCLASRPRARKGNGNRAATKVGTHGLCRVQTSHDIVVATTYIRSLVLTIDSIDR